MISIIIPIFNGEKYIDSCMKSLMHTKEDIEIILVNDGSKDNTKKKLQEYKKNSNITIINQENKGVSLARNKGIEVAKGDYIMFCDVDDYYDNNVLLLVCKKLKEENPDLLIFGRKDIQEKKILCTYPIEKIRNNISNVEYLEEIFCKGFHTYSVCNKVYKRSIIEKNDIKFNEDIHLSEDTLFNLEYIVNCKKISVEQKCYYIRFYNNGSTIYKQYNDFYWDNIKIINLFVDFVNNSSLYKKAIDELYKHYAVVSIDRICTGIDKQSRLKDIENIEEILKDIHNREIKMSNAKGIKNKILYLLMNDKQSILIYFIFSYIRNKYLYLKNKKW